MDIKMIVGFVAVFFIAAIGVGSAGYISDDRVCLSVKASDVNGDGVYNQVDRDLLDMGRGSAKYLSIWIDLPENFTELLDLDGDYRIHLDSDDIAMAKELIKVGRVSFLNDSYVLAADLNLDGFMTPSELNELIRRQTSVDKKGVEVCVTYMVGDYNGDGEVYLDVEDAETSYCSCVELLPQSVRDYMCQWIGWCCVENLPYDEVGDFDLNGVIDLYDLDQQYLTYRGDIPEVSRTVCVWV